MPSRSSASVHSDEFIRNYPSGFELREGEVVEVARGTLASVVGADVLAGLLEWSADRDFWAFGPSCGWLVDERNVRNPSCMVVAKHRLPQLTSDPLFAPPDAMVEVKAFDEPFRDTLDRVLGDMRRGVRLAWAIDPANEVVMAARAGRPLERLEAESFLAGEDVLPDFRLPVTEVFEAATIR